MLNVAIYDGNGNEVVDRRLVLDQDYIVNVYVTGVAGLPESFAPVRVEIIETGYAADAQASLFGVADFLVTFPATGRFTLRITESSGLIFDSPTVREIPVTVGETKESAPVPSALKEQPTGSLFATILPSLAGPFGWVLAIVTVGTAGVYAYKFLKKE